jgi:hypothetical protein
MKITDLSDTSALTEYGMSQGSPTPVTQQQTGGQAKASAAARPNVSPSMKSSPSMLNKPSKSPTTSGGDQGKQREPVIAKAKELKQDFEFPDAQGNVIKVVTPVDNQNNKAGVVVQNTKNKEIYTLDPDDNVVLPQLDQEDVKTEDNSALKTIKQRHHHLRTGRKGHRTAQIGQRIKRFRRMLKQASRHKLGEQPAEPVNETVFSKISKLSLSDQLLALQHLDQQYIEESWQLCSQPISEAVPNHSAPREIQHLLNQPLLANDLKAQMAAYVAVPDPGMIKAFRQARAEGGDTIDLRPIFKSFVDNKVHPKVKQQAGLSESVLMEKPLTRADVDPKNRADKQSRLDAFIKKIETGQQFALSGNTGYVYLDKSQVADMKKGILPSKLVTSDGQKLSWKALEKTAEFGARSGDADDEGGTPGKVANKGEVAEGILGVATFARLIKRPSDLITEADVYALIKSLPPGVERNGVVDLKLKRKETGNPISDLFSLTLRLKPDVYGDFVDESKWPQVKSITAGVIQYVNSNLKKYTEYFSTNAKPDEVKVVADGVSGETDTKVDVFLQYQNKETGAQKVLQHFDMSVKTGSTKQMGQVGGGAATQSMEDRFEILQQMWNKFGVDVSNKKAAFVKSQNIIAGYDIVYAEASKKLKSILGGRNKENEKQFLEILINAIKFFATLNNDRVKLVQFKDTAKGGFYVLDFKKLDRLFDKNLVDLSATYSAEGATPKVTIFNKIDGSPVLSVRMYKSGSGYIRNYIEKEKGLVNLLRVRGS